MIDSQNLLSTLVRCCTCRNWTLLALLFVAAVVVQSQESLQAQQPNYRQPAPAQEPSTIEKIKRNVKHAFSGFGRKKQDESANQQAYQQTQQMMPRANNGYVNQRMASNYQPQYDPRMASGRNMVHQASHTQFPQDPNFDPRQQGYNNQPELPFLQPDMRPPLQQAPQMNSGGYTNDNRQPMQSQIDRPMPPSQMSQQQLPTPQLAPMSQMRGEHYGARSGQMPSRMTPPQHAQPLMQHPQPIIQPASATRQPMQHSPALNGAYQTGHFQNGQGFAQQQFNQQETATQRLLRLSAENQKLTDINMSLNAENGRLKQRLEQKTSLLQKVESAIADARKELQAATQRNTSLRQQLSKLVQEKENLRRASASQLNAIKKRLDEVLKLELTSR